jgi:hypothetical protein
MGVGWVLVGFELRILAGHVFYHLSHTSHPFCSGYFEHGVSFFAQAGLDHILYFMLHFLG